MDLAKVLAHLHEELNNLDAAIESLARLQESGLRQGRSLERTPKPAPAGRRGANKTKRTPPNKDEPPPAIKPD